MILLAILLAAEPIGRTRICDKADATKCASVDATGKVSIGGTISATSSLTSTAAAPTYIEGTSNPFSSDLTGSLRIICMGGTCGGASPFADSAAFTAGATSVGVIAGVFNDSLAALASGKAGAPRQTSFRAMHFNLRDNNGNEIPFPAALAASGGLKVDLQNASTFGAAIPATGIAAGFSDGTNMQLAGVRDTDSGAGTHYTLETILVTPGSGGPVQTGTSTFPLRTDPTGSTTQPVSGSVSLLASPWPGTYATSTGTFNSSSVVDSTAGVSAAKSSSAYLALWVTGGSISSGTLIFECDISNTGVYIPCSGVRLGGTTTGSESSIALASLPATGMAWQFNIAGPSSSSGFRARLNPVIVGAGTVNYTVNSGTSPAPLVTLRDPIPAGTNLIGKVGIDQTTPGTTNAVQVTNAFALDATLTGGSQKAIVRGGAKGATAAADVTSTANGVDHQGLDVAVQGTVTVSGTVTTTPPSNASTNVAQLAGTTTDTNSGAKSAGTLRVVLATDQPALTNKLLVTPDSVALPANQSVNVSQINAVTPLMGNGTTGTGSQRVTIASDNTAFAVNAAATQGAGNTANPWAVQGTVADGVNIAGNPVPVGYKSVAVASAPATVTAGQETYGIGSVERIPYVRTWHPNLISCNVAVSTATTITAFGGSCAAPGAGVSIYITDITFSASAASGTAADSMPTIKSGTGGTCGTGTAVVIEQFNPANGGFHASFQTPYRVPANSELCWIDSTAGSKAVHLHGFIAP